MSLIKECGNDQIFVGMAGMKHHPKFEANEMVKDLQDAGIRVVLFSKESGHELKPFAHELGLESDFNTCICLNASGERIFMEEGREEGLEKKQVLPVGIEEIKQVLGLKAKSIGSRLPEDNIPLQVPMFSQCTEETVMQMIQIYQQSEEVIAYVGSSLSITNLPIFDRADISFGVNMSSCAKCDRCNGVNYKSINQYVHPIVHLSTKFNGFPTFWGLHNQTNLYAFYALFREARRLQTSLYHAIFLQLLATTFLLFPELLALLLGLPPLLDPVAAFLILAILVPALGWTFLSSPMTNSLMKRRVSKLKIYKGGLLRGYDYLWKMVVKCVCGVSLYLLLVQILYILHSIKLCQEMDHEYYKETFNHQISFINIIFFDWGKLLSNNFWKVQFHSMQFLIFCINGCLVGIIALNSQDPRHSITYNFLPNKLFLVVFILSFCGFIGAYFGYLIYAIYQIENFVTPPWYLLIIVLAAIITLLLSDPIVKRYARRHFKNDEDILKLKFETKLGIWSPQ